MNTRVLKLCTWSGVGFAVLFFVGFGLFAGFIPPPRPGNGPAQVAEFYGLHRNGVRIGMVLCLFGLVMWVPFSAVISVHLKRIEGRHTPLSYAQLGVGAGLPPAFTEIGRASCRERV